MDRRKALKNTGLIAGVAVVAPSFLSLLQSCKADNRSTWQPLFLTNEEAMFISTIVDMILPKTETPGALDVKVDIFIDKVFAETYDAKGKDYVRSEIAGFNDHCKNQHGADFVNLSKENKILILKSAEANSGQFRGNVWGTAVGKEEPIGFYRSLKSMAIWAYFTSEEIGKNVLNYDPIPQEYNGCVPLSEIGNRWTL